MKICTFKQINLIFNFLWKTIKNNSNEDDKNLNNLKIFYISFEKVKIEYITTSYIKY